MYKKIIFFIMLAIFLLSCGKSGGNEKEVKKEEKEDKKLEVTVSEKQVEKTPEEEVKEMVELWNRASSNGDLATLEGILGDRIEYYQSSITKDYYIQDQKKFLERNPVYGQSIKGEIEVKKLSDTQYKATFIKEVTTKSETREYPSYLVFAKRADGWKLILESDEVSDENIAKKKEKKKNSNSRTYYYEEGQTLVGVFNIKEIFVEDGAADETGKTIYPYFLFLNPPIQVVPASTDDNENIAETGVKEIQLSLSTEWINFLKKKKAYGKTVRMTGELFHSHTVYHHSEVLMIVENIEILD